MQGMLNSNTCMCGSAHDCGCVVSDSSAMAASYGSFLRIIYRLWQFHHCWRGGVGGVVDAVSVDIPVSTVKAINLSACSEEVCCISVWWIL